MSGSDHQVNLNLTADEFFHLHNNMPDSSEKRPVHRFIGRNAGPVSYSHSLFTFRLTSLISRSSPLRLFVLGMVLLAKILPPSGVV